MPKKSENRAEPAFFRPISPSEHFYMAAAPFSSPFTISLVVQGQGSPDYEALCKAVDTVAGELPGCRLIARGRQWWTTNEPPPVHRMAGSVAQAPEPGRTIDWQHGPTCEVLLYRDGVVFSAFHGVMDGQGVAIWARAVFAEIRQVSWLPARGVTTDFEVTHDTGRRGHSSRKLWPSPLGTIHPSGDAAFLNAKVTGRWQGLPGMALAAAARLLPQDQLGFFIVTADLRRHGAALDFDPNTTANMSRPLNFELSAMDGYDPKGLQQQILRALHENEELDQGNQKAAKRLTLPTFRVLLRLLLRRCKRTGKGSNSGIISHLGFIPLADLSCPGFTATTWRSFSPQFPAIPFAMVLAQSDHHCEITLTCADHPETLAGARTLLSTLSQAEPPSHDTAVSSTEYDSVLTSIWHHSKSDPERIAVVDGMDPGSRNWSYGTLCTAADRVAHSLIEAGIQPGDRVAICGSRRAQTIAAILGTMRAGASYVPIDPNYPPTRIAQIMGAAGARKVLVDDDAPGDLPGEPLPIASLTTAESNPQSAPLPAVDAESIAYVIFTSGSTGTPKGVQVTHANLLHYVAWASRTYGVDHNSGFGFLTSLAFDLTITSIFTPLHSNGRIIAVPEAMHPGVLGKVLSNPEVTCLKLTPTHLQLVGDATSPCGSLRTLIVGGEQLSAPLAWRMQRLLGPQLSIYNEYGPTETTVGCMIHRFDAAHEHEGPVSIGVAAPEVELRIFQPGTENPVSSDGTGELVVSGPGVAAGYLGHDAVDGRHFVSLQDGARAYRTGDLVRRDSDGRLIFVGREDDQVKVHGVRMSLGEIERELCRHPLVEAAAVRPTPENSALVAFVVAGEGTATESLRGQLQDQLPASMIPAYWHLLEALPTTVHGKVDSSALLRLHDSANVSDNQTATVDTGSDPVEQLWVKHEGSGHQFDGDSLALLQLAVEAVEALLPRAQHEGFHSALQKSGMGLTLPRLRQLVSTHSTPA